ncbi:MAG: DUF86 domain-containing protein [Gammaproteobacteria bacterium]|nr:DUF86 domain-containing protein [Gammaproteobacteria bacterium]
MSERGEREFLQDILEAGQRIRMYTKGMTYDAFRQDYKTQDAVIRNLEVIGEAAKNISTEFRSKHPALPWKGMTGMRDRLIHHYFGVNLDIVWDVIQVEMPGVIEQVEGILEQLR